MSDLRETIYLTFRAGLREYVLSLNSILQHCAAQHAISALSCMHLESRAAYKTKACLTLAIQIYALCSRFMRCAKFGRALL